MDYGFPILNKYFAKGSVYSRLRSLISKFNYEKLSMYDLCFILLPSDRIRKVDAQRFMLTWGLRASQEWQFQTIIFALISAIVNVSAVVSVTFHENTLNEYLFVPSVGSVQCHAFHTLTKSQLQEIQIPKRASSELLKIIGIYYHVRGNFLRL